MIATAWVTQLAAEYWNTVGSPEPFPLDLRASIVRSSFDLSVKELPELSIRRVECYLGQLGVRFACGGQDRRLRACLSAFAGAGLILVEATDAPRERVFSLAHELAHFLRHYWWVRRQACRRLGTQILDVMDGFRPATPEERIQAVVADVPIGLHVHLMERGPRRQVCSTAIRQAEAEADQLAYELLAPAREVAARTGPVRGPQGQATLTQLLREEFGLPAAQAPDYAQQLLPLEIEDSLVLGLRRS